MKISTRWSQDNSVDIISTGPRWSKTSIFRRSGKPLKMTKIITRWPMENSDIKSHLFWWEIRKIGKLAKKWLFRQGRCRQKLQFYGLSWKPLKKMIIITSWPITKACLYNVDPLNPLLYSKTGVYRGIHYFLITAQKHKLWVLVRTASPRRF